MRSWYLLADSPSSLLFTISPFSEPDRYIFNLSDTQLVHGCMLNNVCCRRRFTALVMSDHMFTSLSVDVFLGC